MLYFIYIYIYMDNIFFEIGLIIITTSVLALIFNLLRQPIILAYLLAGVILGPLILGYIPSGESVAGLSHFGIAFLLFLIGLELDLRKLKHSGTYILLVGAGQILLTFGIFYLLFSLKNLSATQTIFFALSLTFSSTVIIVKLLSEKFDLAALYGKILIGVLLLQDVVAIIGIIFINSIGGSTEGTGAAAIAASIALLIGKALLLLFAVWFFARYILREIFKFVAKSPEILFISALAWCFVVAILSHLLGLSVEIGAFLAGITLATSPYVLEIVARVKPLRDFFVIILFVALGAQIEPTGFIAGLPLILLFCLFGLLLKPLIAMVVCSLVGYNSRTSFLTSISLGQISEFTFIAALLAFGYHFITKNDLSVITASGIITIAVSSYFIFYGDWLYRIFRKPLKIFEKLNLRKFEDISTLPEKLEDHIIIFGCRNTGKKILGTLRHYGHKVLVVDFDPEIVRKLQSEGIPAIYGDMNDIEILERLNLEKAKLVISTVDDEKDNTLLLEILQRKNKKLLFFATAPTVEEAYDLYKKGIGLVIIPRILSGEHLSQIVRDHSGDMDKLYEHHPKRREHAIKELKKLLPT